MKTLIAGLTTGLLMAGSAAAQELEPRAYSPSPVGTTFVVVGASRSAGGVFTDASLPLTNVEATVGILGLSIGRTFGLSGKQVLVLGAARQEGHEDDSECVLSAMTRVERRDGVVYGRPRGILPYVLRELLNV